MKTSAYIFLLFLLSPFLQAKNLQELSCTHPRVCALLFDLKREGAIQANIHQVIGLTGDPHHFSPTPNDLRKLEQSEFLLTESVYLSPWIKKVVKLRQDQGKTTKSLQSKEDPSSHFWTTPLGLCEAREQIQHFLDLKNSSPCPYLSLESQLKNFQNIFQQTVFILTHDALEDFFTQQKAQYLTLLQGHSHSLSAQKLKELINIRKKYPQKKIVWVLEEEMKGHLSMIKNYQTKDDVLWEISILAPEKKSGAAILQEILKKLKEL